MSWIDGFLEELKTRAAAADDGAESAGSDAVSQGRRPENGKPSPSSSAPRAGVASVRFGFRRLAPSAVDARVFADPGDSGLNASAVEALRADPRIESVRRKRGEVSVRFTSACVAEVARALLERGLPRSRGRLAGELHVVNFLNPNATKPLHVGHVRNVALGMALCGLLDELGATVRRQCYICDVGRSIAEAMAGYERAYAGQTPGDAGLRPDVLVGRCYSDYASAAAAAMGPAADPVDEGDPAGRDAVLAGDRADELMAGWSKREPAARDLWARLRGWALEGQRATTDRLGVRWDRVHYESESLAAVERLVRRGLSEDFLSTGVDREVHFRTGRQDYAQLTLVRADGFPTEHARVIGLFLAEAECEPPPLGWHVVCGEEWGAAGAAELDIAARAGAAELARRVQVVTHGMVTVAGSKMKSRDGRAVLADDLLDAVAADPLVQGLVGQSEGRATSEDLVGLLVKGFFLSKRPNKGIEFDPESFCDPRRNPAVELAKAWARARARRPVESRPAVSLRELAQAIEANDDLRTAALQVFQLHDLRERAAERLDVAQLVNIAKFAVGLSSWYLGRPQDPLLDRIVATVLAGASRSLGIALGAPAATVLESAEGSADGSADGSRGQWAGRERAE